jgi:hypothetical protein
MSYDPNKWREPIVLDGFLGWGNRKNGCEAYGPGGRWFRDGPNTESGDLLGDALERAGGAEGMPLIVVALDRFAHSAAAELQTEIEEAVARWLQRRREGHVPEVQP